MKTTWANSPPSRFRTTWKTFYFGDAYNGSSTYFIPVEPHPPSPLSESDTSSTIVNSA